jgi:hypothetical protein
MSDEKVVELFPNYPFHGGTFSNRLEKQRTSEEMMRDLRDTMAKVKRMEMRLVTDPPPFVVPPNWETSWPADIVAEIKRQLGG